MAESALKNILMIAGEASGDLHGANLIQAILRKRHVSFFGIGGSAMENAGASLFYHIKELSVMGITEIVSKLPGILTALSKTKKALKQNNPDLVILIDFPGFNLKVAKAASKMNIPVLYYISPKIWASRPGRAKKIKKWVTHMAIILPFEQAFFKGYDIPVTYVGNPLLDTNLLAESSDEPKQEEQGSIIGLLPGSREKEVAGLLPVMLAAAEKLKERNPSLRFVVSLAPSIDAQLMEAIVSPFRDKIIVDIMTGDIKTIFKKADFLVAASGTVTLEAAICGIPMVVVYKVSGFSHFIGKMIIKVDYISLVNLIADKEVVPELVQKMANATAIAEKVSDIMDDGHRLNQMKADLKNVREALGKPGASDRVADIALKMIGS